MGKNLVDNGLCAEIMVGVSADHRSDLQGQGPSADGPEPRGRGSPNTSSALPSLAIRSQPRSADGDKAGSAPRVDAKGVAVSTLEWQRRKFYSTGPETGREFAEKNKITLK